MSILVKQIHTLSHDYVRSGSKANRRLQVGRIIKFVAFVEKTEHLHNLHEIGRRHVICFWKGHRELAPKTAHDYWLALCVLWRWSGKSGSPPKPMIFFQSDALQTDANATLSVNCGKAVPSLIEISQALRTYRISSTLTIEAIAKATGLDQVSISEIEAGSKYSRYDDIAMLFNFYATIFNT